MISRAASFSLRSLLTALGLGGLVLGAAMGCNAQVATVLASDDAGTSIPGDGSGGTQPAGDGGTPGDGGSGGDCAARGGTCLPAGESAPPSYRKAAAGEGSCTGTDVCWLPVHGTSKVPVCYNDQGCNPGPGISTLYGSCFHGICQCKPGYYVQPDGHCQAVLPPECSAQPNTSCANGEVCPAGSLAGSANMNMSCGDFVAAVCCTQVTACEGPAMEAPGGGWGPVDMVCCLPNDAETAPICVNGFMTCPEGALPNLKQFGCG